MITRRKVAIIAICLVLLSSIMAGCIEKEEAHESVTTPAQVLTIGYGRDTNVESPKMMGFMPEMMVLERLIEYREGKILPILATSWDIQDNGKTIVFHLKKNIKFSDGSLFTAERLSNNYLNHIRIAFAHIKSDSSCIQHFDSPT